MADAKIKKIIGNLTKLNYFHAYIVNMSFYPGKLLAILPILYFIYIYNFSEVMVKYEFSQ